MLSGIPIRVGYAFWIITAFFIIGVVSTFSGYTYAPAFYAPLYIKEALKHGIFWLLFYSVLHCIDNREDFRNQFTMFSLAATAGAVVVILHYFFTYTIDPIFGSPFLTERMGVILRYRGVGSFSDPNGAACVLVCCLIFLLTTIQLYRRLVFKILAYSSVFLMLIGVMVTQSRSGLMTLIGSFLLMALFSKTKKIAWLVVVSGIIVVLLTPNIRGEFWERIAESYDPTSGTYGVSVYGRFGTWKSYFENSTAQTYVFGQGFTQGVEKNVGETHSAYISLITVYGFGSVVWAIVGAIIFFKKVSALKRSPDPLISIVASGCFWSLIAWGIYGTSADAVSNQYTRYLLFYWVVLIDRASALAYREQESTVHDEEIRCEMAL
jgi:hypothetical protein